MLSPMEEKVLKYIYTIKAEAGIVPSARQISTRLGFKSSRSAQNYINALKSKGYLVHRKPETSSYALADSFQSEDDSPSIPLLGAIAAGFPAESFDTQDRRIDLPKGFFGHDTELFALRVMGDSMSGDSICEGDIAIVRKGDRNFGRNDILAIRVGPDEFTLKRLRHKNIKIVELLPSNPQYPVVEAKAEDISIVGIFVGLMRRAL